MHTPMPLLDPLVRLVARRRLSLHQKLILSFLLIVALLLGTAVLGLLLMRHAGAQADRIAMLTDRVLSAARMEYIITSSMHFRAMHLLTGDTENDKKLVRARQEFANLVGAMETTAEGPERDVFRKIRETNLRFAESGQRVDILAHGSDRGDNVRAMAVHLNEEHPISHELEALARDLIRLASVRRDESLREVDRSIRVSGWLLGAAGFTSVALALLLGYVVTWSLLTAVRQLDEHMGRVTRGELDQEIQIPNRDEFRDLAHHANEMMHALSRTRAEILEQQAAITGQARVLEESNRDLAEKVQAQVEEIERSRRLSNYLAPQVVRAITSGNSTFALENARKQLTILFADIRGFTAYSDNAEPEEVITFLNAYLSRMTDLVFKYEGTLDKFLGDGLLVFFNDPLPQPDHAKRAVQMALDMQEQARELAGESWVGDASFGIGIGISTGFVTVGTIGSEHRMEYTVVGTQVNLAARLVSVAEPGQIVISQRTYQLVQDLVEAVQVGPFTVKGIHRPVEAYNVLRVKGTATPLRATA